MTLSVNARVATSTINEQLAKITEPGNVKRTLLGLVGTWGALKTNKGGKATDWRVKYRENQPEVYQDGDPVTAVQMNRHRTAEVQWLAWSQAEAFTKFEKLANQSKKSMLFDLIDYAVTASADDFKKYMAKQLYYDGDVSGEYNLHGLETMYSDISEAGDGSTEDSKCGVPAGSYAGLNMTLNNYGQGTWTGAWPDGNGTLEYFFFSPVVADITNTGWAQSSNTWPYTWRLAMNYVVTFTDALHQETPSVWMMTPDMLRECQDSLIDKERIDISVTNPDLVKLGFRGINWNGIPLLGDYACTANVCYGIPKEHIELRSMQSQLVEKEDDEDVTIKTKKICFDSFCQMRFTSPAFFPCLREIT